VLSHFLEVIRTQEPARADQTLLRPRSICHITPYTASNGVFPPSLARTVSATTHNPMRRRRTGRKPVMLVR
jgi:hypothetical protein